MMSFFLTAVLLGTTVFADELAYNNATNFNESIKEYGSFDWTLGTYALWHSENAYCNPDTYLTRTNKGAASNL